MVPHQYHSDVKFLRDHLLINGGSESQDFIGGQPVRSELKGFSNGDGSVAVLLPDVGSKALADGPAAAREKVFHRLRRVGHKRERDFEAASAGQVQLS